MSGFTRSPSKVFWGSDNISWSHRTTSSSPGSQDSGFSDTETSPSVKAKTEAPQKLDILKDTCVNENTQNLSRNVKDKLTPKKQILLRDNARKENDACCLNIPMRKLAVQAKSDPQINRFKYAKNHPKVNKRNLFRSIQMDTTHNSTKRRHQYARGGSDQVQDSDDINNEVTYNENISWTNIDITDSPHGNITVPIVRNRRRVGNKIAFNISAPVILSEDEELVTSFTSSTSSYSDSDSELECLFAGTIESPRHTSTPKFSGKRESVSKLERKHVMNLLAKYQHER